MGYCLLVMIALMSVLFNAGLCSLLDVTERDIGVRTRGGVMSVVMPRNSLIPGRKRRIFTIVNNVTSLVMVDVYEGTSSFVRNNALRCSINMGEMKMTYLRLVEIEVTVTLDSNGAAFVEAEAFTWDRKGNCTLPRDHARAPRMSFEEESMLLAQEKDEMARLILKNADGNLLPIERFKGVPHDCDNYFQCKSTGDVEFHEHVSQPLE